MQGVGGLNGRVLTWIAKGVGLSPTWHHSFPWKIGCLGIILLFPLMFRKYNILATSFCRPTGQLLLVWKKNVLTYDFILRYCSL